MSLLSAGKLDRRLRIEQKTISKDSDYGSPVEIWSTFATVWGSVLDVLNNNQESTVNSLRTLKRPCKVRVRYMAGITADMRIYFIERNRYLQIVSAPAEIGRKEGLEFLCEEYSSDGTL